MLSQATDSESLPTGNSQAARLSLLQYYEEDTLIFKASLPECSTSPGWPSLSLDYASALSQLQLAIAALSVSHADRLSAPFMRADSDNLNPSQLLPQGRQREALGSLTEKSTFPSVPWDPYHCPILPRPQSFPPPRSQKGTWHRIWRNTTSEGIEGYELTDSQVTGAA